MHENSLKSWDSTFRCTKFYLLLQLPSTFLEILFLALVQLDQYHRLWNIPDSTSRSSKTAKVSQPSFCLWCNILQILSTCKRIKASL